MTDCVQVLTTAGSEEEAGRIAAALVERRLAACVQVVGPIVSRYRWQGGIQEEREWQCLAKTTRAAYGAVEGAIREAHPYEEPEIVATPIVAGSAGYLAWIGENVKRSLNRRSKIQRTLNLHPDSGSNSADAEFGTPRWR